MKKKNIGIAVVSVPILAAGTVALASSYRESTNYKPSDTEQEIQVNQVVFDDSESGTGHSKKKDGDESRLLKNNKNTDESESTQLEDQADYLFENSEMHTESVGLLDEESEDAPETENRENSETEGQPEKVYNITKDSSSADTSLNNPSSSAGDKNSQGKEQSGSTDGSSGNQSGQHKGNNNSTSSTIKPSQSGNTGNTGSGGNNSNPNSGNNGNTGSGGNTGNDTNNGNTVKPTPTPTKKPAETARDPESEKTNPSSSGFFPSKPYVDGVKPDKDTEEDGSNSSVIIRQADIYYEAFTMYEGQSVSRKDIYNALDTLVYGKDGVTYVWGADALDKYIKIDAVSFDSGKSWTDEFPVTIPSGLKSGQMQIRVYYRMSVNDSEWQERIVSYEAKKNRIFVLSEQLKEENQTIDKSQILNTADQYPDVGTNINLLRYQADYLSKDTLTELFPGWMENGEIVSWFYKAGTGRHILEPAEMVKLDPAYTVKVIYQWMSDKYDVGTEYSNLCYLQTLTDCTEDAIVTARDDSGQYRKLSVPKYIQAVIIDSSADIDTDYLEIPDTVLYFKSSDTGLTVRKAFQVSEENPRYTTTEEGILTNKNGTEYIAIPYDIKSLTIPETVNRIVITQNNQISEIRLNAEILDEIPEIAYKNLKNCNTIIKNELLNTYVERNYTSILQGENNTIAAAEDTETVYKIENESIVSDQGMLRYVLHTGRSNYAMPEDVTTVQTDAFNGVSGLTTVILPKNGKEVTLEKDCFAGSEIKKIHCYSADQFYSVADQLEQSGAPENVSIELVDVSADGISYSASEKDGEEVVTVIDVPDTITSFDGNLTLEDGSEIMITAVGDAAFENCKKLKWVYLPETVNHIGYQAFKNCTALQGLFISTEDFVYIGNLSVEGCDSLRFIASNAKQAEVQDGYAPKIMDSFGNYCFYVPTGSTGYTEGSVFFTAESGVYGYEMVDIGDGHQMLYGVDEDWQPWLGIRSETEVPDLVQLPTTTIELYCGAMEETHSPSGKYELQWDELTEMYAFDQGAFSNSDLGGDIVLCGNNIWGDGSYISSSVFAGCKNITSVTVPNTSYYIGEYAFTDCVSLKTLNITGGAGGCTIYPGSFYNCNELTDITFESALPPSMITYGTSRCQFNAAWSQEEEAEKLRIHVPQGTETDYVKSWRYPWCGYVDTDDATAYMRMWDDVQWNNINWDTFEFPSDEETMQLLEQELLIKENYLRQMLGIETVEEPTNLYHYKYENWELTLLGVPSGLESLDLGFTWDMEIPLFSSFNYIGSNAFKKSANLNQLTVPDTVKGLYEEAFAGITSEKLVLNFEGITPPSLIRDGSDHAFSMGIEDSRIELKVPEGYEKDYIREWRYALSGYENLEEVRQAVIEELKAASETGEEPTEEAVNEAVGWKLLPAENRLRAMMGMELLDKPEELSEDTEEAVFSDGEQKEDAENTTDETEESVGEMEITVGETENPEETPVDEEPADSGKENDTTQAEEGPDDADRSEEAFTEQNAESAEVSVESEEDIQE